MAPPDLSLTTYLLPILLIGLLLMCSALISGSEVAFFSLKPNDLEDLENDGKKNSSKVLQLLRKPNEKEGPRNLLATILVLNNLINVAIILIATVKTQEFIKKFLIQEEWIVFGINIIGITFVLVLFGEVIPKLYANTNNLRVSRMMSGPLIILQKGLTPVWKPLVLIGKRLDRRILNPSKELSVNELSKAIELTDDDERTAEEKEIFERIIKFGDKDAKQIMTPRTDIVSFSIDETWKVLRNAVIESGFTRIPIHKGSMDEVVGVLHIKDLIPLLELETAAWSALLREPYFITENMMIDDLLKEFQERKVHMAIVVDEYGGTSGLITLEDVLEEIVGDITDEFDVEQISFSRLDDKTYIMAAKTPLVDFYRILELDDELWEESKGESDTLGGFIIEQAGSIPKEGECVLFENVKLIVDAGDDRKIERVKIEILSKPS